MNSPFHAIRVAALASLLVNAACAQVPERAVQTLDDSAVLTSAGALAFDSGSVLFVGDSKAGKVHAFDFGADGFDDQSGYPLGRVQTFEGRTIIDGIDRQIAAMLGVDPDDIAINDLAVHQSSKQIFLSVHRGRGPNAEAMIFRVNRGELQLVDTARLKKTSQSVGPVPQSQTLEFGQPLNQLAITDIDYYDGEIFVAGVSSDTFSSKLRRMTYPFKDDVQASSIEIWHAVHAQYETRAPIITQTIAELDGNPMLIAIYACTPIVRIPLSELKDGAKVRGEMIGEMGYGNTPIDIFTYVNGWDQSENVVVTNTNRSAVQIPFGALASADQMPSGEGVAPVFSVSGVMQNPLPLSGTLHLDAVDDSYAVAIRRSPEDLRNLQLHTLPLPFFFDRADHIVEMNWDDGPDPFGYKSAPKISFDE